MEKNYINTDTMSLNDESSPILVTENKEATMFNFNLPISRVGTHAEKYDLRKQVFGTEDVLPMWVADMDLPTPPFVLNAIKSRLNHTLLGYTHTPDSVYQAIIDWQKQHSYSVDKTQIVFTHNVANGFFMAVSALTRPGDSVLVQLPIYPPFIKAPKLHDRKLVETPLQLVDNRYEVDFKRLKRLLWITL